MKKAYKVFFSEEVENKCYKYNQDLRKIIEKFLFNLENHTKNIENIKKDNVYCIYCEKEIEDDETKCTIYSFRITNGMRSAFAVLPENKYIYLFDIGEHDKVYDNISKKIEHISFNKLKELRKTNNKSTSLKELEKTPSEPIRIMHYINNEFEETIREEKELRYEFSPKQYSIIKRMQGREKFILIEGSAGTGKTLVMIRAALGALKNGYEDEKIEQKLSSALYVAHGNDLIQYWKNYCEKLSNKLNINIPSFKDIFSIIDGLKESRMYFRKIIEKVNWKKFEKITRKWKNSREIEEMFYSYYSGKLVDEKLLAYTEDKKRTKALKGVLEKTGINIKDLEFEIDTFFQRCLEKHKEITIKSKVENKLPFEVINNNLKNVKRPNFVKV